MLLNKFKQQFKRLMDECFENIPINITVNFNNSKFIVKVEDEDEMVFDQSGQCSNKPDDLTQDLEYLCNQCIDKYKQECGENTLTEDGESCGGDVSGDCSGADNGGGESIGDVEIQPTNPENNSTTVGKGCYVAYVCPSALSRRLFNKYYYNYKRRKNKGK